MALDTLKLPVSFHGAIVAYQRADGGTIIWEKFVMKKIGILDAAPTSDQEYEAAVEHYLGEIRLLQQQMDVDQREIEALRMETDATITQLMQTLKMAA